MSIQTLALLVILLTTIPCSLIFFSVENAIIRDSKSNFLKKFIAKLSKKTKLVKSA